MKKTKNKTQPMREILDRMRAVLERWESIDPTIAVQAAEKMSAAASSFQATDDMIRQNYQNRFFELTKQVGFLERDLARAEGQIDKLEDQNHRLLCKLRKK